MQHENIAHKKSGTAGGTTIVFDGIGARTTCCGFYNMSHENAHHNERGRAKKAHIAEPARVAFSHFSMFKYFHSLYGVTNLLNN